METQYIKCSGCRCLRAEDEYEIYKGTRRKSCLKCKANRIKYQEKSKIYRDGRKDKKREMDKKYRENNLEKKKEYLKEYRENNKEYINQRVNEWRRNNKCEHNKYRGVCSICNLQLYLVNLQRSSLKRMLKISNLSKIKPTIAYLGCSAEYFKEYLQKKMTDEMTFENIHIDHIKPVSRFNLDDPDEFSFCCHYTNLQPLLATDNIKKGDKWTEENEIYWNDNIKGKETTEIYNPYKK